jgi:hypothetical protein
MNDTKTEREFEEYLYFGSNEWLYQFRTYLDKYIKERKKYTHELYFLIFSDSPIPEHKSITYTTEPIELLKKEGKKILHLHDIPYKKYMVYLRRFEDNNTILLATKQPNSLIEVTIDYIKLINIKNNEIPRNI